MRTPLVCLIILTYTTVVIAETQNIGWNSFTFGLIWPPTYCYSYIRPIPDGVTSFTIHGLWPQIYPDITPNCTPTVKFNLTLLDPLRPELDHKWPCLRDCSAAEVFWENEFKKHGHCAVQDPQIRSVFGYFKAAVEVYNKTDLLNTLERNNIVPSNRTLYNRTYFQNVLKKEYGFPGWLLCRQGRGKGVTYYNFEEVRFCMNRSFAHINCTLFGPCPEKFYLPPFFNSSELINVTRRRRWGSTKRRPTRRRRP
ncbi:unnamed protein product [Schistosoma turkestanicum]|nr:unnamed protein product [Schistosoma turkestanicum]